MYDEDDGLVFSFLLGSFLGLADYYGEILLKSGPAKKIFEDEDHRDVMIELMDGRICYAKDSDLATLDATYRAFKAEYQNSSTSIWKDKKHG